MSLTRSSWQIETITGVAWEVEKELVFRRLPQEDPNKTVEESRMDAWKDLVEDVQRSQPAGSVENPHYAPHLTSSVTVDFSCLPSLIPL